MRSNFINKILVLIFFIFFQNISNSAESFNFDVTEVEILENGNIFKGSKRGTITTDDGIKLEADNFKYNKSLNILNANGNVKIEDNINNYILFSKEITYLRNKNIIFTKNKSKAINLNDNSTIEADEFEYNKNLNILNANKDVVLEDKLKDYKIISENITYFKNKEKFVTEGKTKAFIDSSYEFNSKNVIFLKNEMKLSSDNKTTIIEKKKQFYSLNKFIYFINDQELRGEKIVITTNYGLPKSDKYYFEDGIFNFSKRKFLAKDTKIEIHKDIFDNTDNDPRLNGVSSSGDDNITIINKGIFTSCKKRDGCPPWTVKADEIKHDRKKKQLNYKNAVVQIYDIPVFYFPKFFHPDPSVKRQSGLLKPTINHSTILGSSLTVPYYKDISQSKDFTFRPTWFDNRIWTVQNEFRQANQNSNFIADFGYVRGYKSKTNNKKKNFRHLFANYDLDLNFDNFESSNLFISLEKASDDAYLKIFEPHITESTAKASNLGVMNSQVKLTLNNKKYNFETGFHSYENLSINKNSDRYQFILPYYDLGKILSDNFMNGFIHLNSNGSNDLNETNVLKSRIINDIHYESFDYITDLGFKNKFKIDFKNVNTVGKNHTTYKSSPELDLVTLLDMNISMPLIKNEEKFINYLTPKVSLRYNPTNMIDHSTSTNTLYVDNIFNTNRLGLSDTLESGRSITLGLDYKKEKTKYKKNTEDEDIDSINKYFEFKLATVIRDKEEKNISTTSTLNRSQSNLFGSISNNLFENVDFKYTFAMDNDFNKLEYSDLNTSISINNLVTTFNFIEIDGEMGNDNSLETNIEYSFDENNLLSFKTRRNRKLNLTEYYDLIYEYKNDCLTAGVKYKKTYYQDRDIKPEENLLFTITLFPLTTYEYQADELVTGELFSDL